MKQFPRIAQELLDLVRTPPPFSTQISKIVGAQKVPQKIRQSIVHIVNEEWVSWSCQAKNIHNKTKVIGADFLDFIWI